MKWAAAHPGQDRRLPSVVTHSRLQRATSVRSRVEIVVKKKTAAGSLSAGSPAGRTLPHGDGPTYSQANVSAGKVLRPPYPSVALRDRGHWKGVAGSGWARWNVTPQRVCFGWKGDRPGVRLESRSGEPVRIPKITSGCSICSYPGKNGRCPKIIENSQIGMSRHLDSSTTTQMVKIMVQTGRSSRSSWAKSVRSSFDRTVMGKAI